MKIKKYGEFVNEELSNDAKYILKNLPYFLGNKLISHLLGAAPLLSSKWKSLKDKSKGLWSHYDSSGHSKLKKNLTKIQISDLPDTPLKKGLYPLFNNWNIYKADEKSTGGVSKGPERPVIYISKDELEIGDYITSIRESGWETEEIGTYKSKSGKNLIKRRNPSENDPIFVLAAKYDVDEFLHKDIVEDLKDIMNCDIEDVGLEVFTFSTSLENDSISCVIKKKEGYDDQIINEEIYLYLENNVKRFAGVLKSQTGKEWSYSIYFSTVDNTISKENQIKILDHYQKDTNFWNNLSRYKLYSDSRPESLKIYFRSNHESILEELFGNGKYKNIILFKNSEEVIKPFNLKEQGFNKIFVEFNLRKG